MNQIQAFKKQIQQILGDKKIKTAVIVCGVSLTAAILLDSFFKDSAAEAKSSPQQDLDVATLIPAGNVLIPILLHNKESLSSLMGSYGVVDLYQVDPQKGKGKRVARGVRILRAPNDPNQFGVLIPEDDADLVVATNQELVAVLQNTKLRENALLTRPKKSQNQVEYHQ